MKKIILFVSVMLCSVVSMGAEVVDTVSYAFGYQITLSMFAGQNPLIQDDKDFSEYMKGLEDKMKGESVDDGEVKNEVLNDDPSFKMSYDLGGMAAVFLTDGNETRLQSGKIPVKCIVEGLRDVAEGRVELPKDTIEATRLINSYDKNVDPVELDMDERCAFFRAFGIMKAMAPDLQSFIDEMTADKDTVFVADRRAYAKGMADMLESSFHMPENAYELGTMLGKSIKLGSLPFELDVKSFLDGAKDVWGFGEPLVPRQRIESILNEYLYEAEDAEFNN